MTHLYYGEGKGKTTAALGLAVRAAGNGWRVIFVQFLKNAPAGEVSSLEKLGATVLRGKAGNHFFSQMTDAEKSATKAISDEHFARAVAMCAQNTTDGGARERGAQPTLLVLDEICAAYNHHLVSRAAVDDFLRAVPNALELVLTGRNPPEHFFACADYVTEMKKIRHPYDTGTAARKGVEF